MRWGSADPTFSQDIAKHLIVDDVWKIAIQARRVPGSDGWQTLISPCAAHPEGWKPVWNFDETGKLIFLTAAGKYDPADPGRSNPYLGPATELISRSYLPFLTQIQLIDPIRSLYRAKSDDARTVDGEGILQENLQPTEQQRGETVV